MKSKNELTKDELEKREKRKLAGIYRKLDKDAKKSVESLIEEAAFMAASLYELSEPERRQEMLRSGDL